jgi:hypothetical protein
VIKNATNSSHIQLTLQTKKKKEAQTNLVSLSEHQVQTTGGSISHKSRPQVTGGSISHKSRPQVTGGSISHKSEDLKTSLTQTYLMILTPSYTSHLKTNEKQAYTVF